MVPREFRKSLCIAAGIITLLEAEIWGAASIYGIGVYNCDWDVIKADKGVSVWSLLNITYLMGGCRGPDAASRLGYSFVPPAGAATSLQVWLWTNAILSVIWILACFLLIVAVVAEVRGKIGALMYYPWEALTVVLIVFDFAGTVYHAADVFQTTTPDNYAKFTYAKSWENLTLQSPSEGITTWLPSLLVTLFFCRLLIGWILNIFLVFSVFKASHAVSLYSTKNFQTTNYNAERRKSWKDIFYHGPDPTIIQNQAQVGTFQTEAEDQSRNPDNIQQQARLDTHVMRQELSHRYKTEEFGIPIEEFNNQIQRSSASNLNKDNSPRSPYQQRRHVGRPVTPDSFNEHWQDTPPPMASEIKVPPELSRVRPFSYTAGDQPQLMKANISRSNSRAEYPPIPRPDYSIADRRTASLEYIPNRFKVPAPKRPVQTQIPFNFDQRSPTQSKAPIPSKKPHVHPRTTVPVAGDAGLVPQTKYIPQLGQAFYSRQSSRTNDYNINKLY